MFSDPANADRQSALSSSYITLGDVLRSEGKRAEARKAYKDAFTIRKRLADADPTNANRQSEMSASHAKLGNLLQYEGELLHDEDKFGQLRGRRSTVGTRR